ncbi:phosphate transport system regulatory protein PhoU [Amycolatopsis sp. WAC 01376]|uniref:phosphate signaling complex protein PhoU n=1 Tax=Amycolatopsis sp. WAC 01376 TaxID=2203195 RepID=UPI000F7940A9|nr:phosphate signaling complex protein PhoU [Amycolatopsis sp. WAC 01376]RSM57581.1 phosphate transport system regulatory protein PhoU [Amycolatopsis sp. WAC 01376]
MRTSYHEQLDRLVARLPRMSRVVADMMDRAGTALFEADGELAREVVAESAALERAKVEAEGHAHAILALQSPVATDLRVVLAAIHAVGDLDRMGRLAIHVAEAVQRRYPDRVVPQVLMPRFVEMSRIAVWLAVMAGQAVESRDAVLARTLISVDDDMDDLHRTLFTVIDYQDWAYGTVKAVDAVLLSRYYERFADHAVSLARQTTFVVTSRPKWTGSVPVQCGVRIA